MKVQAGIIALGLTASAAVTLAVRPTSTAVTHREAAVIAAAAQ